MDKKEPDIKTKNDALAEAVKRTPRIFSVEDLCGLSDDDEDRYINARRERERGW